MTTLLPYAVLLTGLLLMAGLFRKNDWLERSVCIGLLGWTLLESVWTLVQTFRDGLETYRYPFIVSGSFYSPAPFGALLAIGLVVAAASVIRLRKEKALLSRIQYGLSLATLLPAAIVLVSSRSRSAWVGLLVALLLLLLRETRFKEWIRRRRAVAVAAVVLALVAGALMFRMKQDSAIGRFHLWHMECRAIAAHPWTGVGFSHVLKAYGDAQVAYFQEAERPEVFVRVADSPVYVFNEYLKFGMAWGIGGLLLSVAVAVWVVWRLFRKRSVLAYGALVYALFAFASFPLSVVQLKLLGTLLLAVALVPERRTGWLTVLWGLAFCACLAAAVRAYPEARARRDAERIWRSSLLMELDTDSASARLAPLYAYLKDNPRYLYQYGCLLHETGAYQESNRVLQLGAERSCDPAFHTRMAENYVALGDLASAEKENRQAYWLAPGRR